MLARLDQGQQLLLGQRPRQPAGLPHPQRSGGHRPAAGDVLQERPVAAPVDPPPRHQRLRYHHPVTGLPVVEGEQRGQVLVHRRRAAPTRTAGQHRDVLRRGPQPRHEPGNVFHRHLVDGHAQSIQELRPQLQARRVRADRGRGPIQRLQMRQEPLHRGHRPTARVKDSPGLRPVRHQHPLHPHRDLLPRCVTGTVEGSHDSPAPTKSAPAHRRPSATAPRWPSPTRRTRIKRTLPRQGV